MFHGSAPHAVAPGAPPPTAAGKCGASSGARHPRREVEQPAGLGELGDPDHVEHQHVEGRRRPLEVDHVELVLLVAGPGELLAAHRHPGVGRLELAQQAGDGIGGAEDLGVLEHQRDRAAGLARARRSRRAAGAQAGQAPRGTDARAHGAYRSRRGSSSPKIVAPRRKASGSVAAAPAGCPCRHHAARWSSDRKKLSVCQSEVHALPRRSRRSPTHAISPSPPTGPSGVTSSAKPSPQW